MQTLVTRRAERGSRQRARGERGRFIRALRETAGCSACSLFSKDFTSRPPSAYPTLKMTRDTQTNLRHPCVPSRRMRVVQLERQTRTTKHTHTHAESLLDRRPSHREEKKRLCGSQSSLSRRKNAGGKVGLKCRALPAGWRPPENSNSPLELCVCVCARALVWSSS